MVEENFDKLFECIQAFEWDEKKYRANLRDHKIDFEDVRAVFDNYTVIRRSDRRGEIRYQLFGFIDGREIAVACTIRETRCRIISARRARKDERRKYYNRLAGRSAEGQD